MCRYVVTANMKHLHYKNRSMKKGNRCNERKRNRPCRKDSRHIDTRLRGSYKDIFFLFQLFNHRWLLS